MAVGKIRATKPGNARALKKALKESSGGDKWFYRVPADEEFTFRLMVEPYDFTSFKQHFIQEGKDTRVFPCNEGDCEGCDEGNDPRPVWVAPVVDVAESRVRVLQMPKSIVESLMKKADRPSGPGTVMDRDWILIREGSGKDNTRYELDSNSPKRRDLSIYEEPDIMAMLEAQLEEVTGGAGYSDEDDEDDEPPRRTSRTTKKTAARSGVSKRATRRVSRDVWAEEDEDANMTPSDRRPLKRVRKAEPAPKRATKKTLRR